MYARHRALRRELASRIRPRQPQLPHRRDRLHRRPAPLGVPRRAARQGVLAALSGPDPASGARLSARGIANAPMASLRDASAVPAAHGAVSGRAPAAADLRAALHRDGQGVPPRRHVVRRVPDPPRRRGAAERRRRAGIRDDRNARPHRDLGHAGAGNPARQRRRRDALRGALARDAAGRSRRRRRSRRLPPSPASPLAAGFQPLAQLLELLAARAGPHQFPDERSFDDASWVGYRLAELLPLPLSIKQSMLEINDAEVRLSVLQAFLKQQGLAVANPRSGYNCRIQRGQKRTDHGWPQQMGEHQAQEGGHRRQARQDLHAPHPRNHRRRAGWAAPTRR